MGKRRMFSKDIVRSDAFLDLPQSSQALYFQLGMDTDDRGYISNAKSIIRVLGANKGDLEQLVSNGFILIRGETLLLQKHFQINNVVRKDRLIETNYWKDLQKLFIEENGAYTTNECNGSKIEIDYKKVKKDNAKVDKFQKKVESNQNNFKECQPNDNQRLTNGSPILFNSILFNSDKKDKREIKYDKTSDKKIADVDFLTKNNFVSFLLANNYLQEIDFIDIPEYEEYFNSLFEGYDKQLDPEAWKERYKLVTIATKYFVKQFRNRIEDTNVDNKLSYLKCSIDNSLTRNYNSIPEVWKDIEKELSKEVK